MKKSGIATAWISALSGLVLAFGSAACDNDNDNLCGNGRVDRGETCDASAVGGRTCEDEGFVGGTLSCNATCDDFDTSGCYSHICGNDSKEGGEVCDGEDFGGNSCSTLGMGFSGGTLACNGTCDAFDTTGCIAPDLGGIEGDADVGGTVTCDASDLNTDCMGDVYIHIVPHDPQLNPNQVALGEFSIEDVDLTGDATVSYAIAGVPTGTWYITGFLDDNSSVTPTGVAPDTGDPVISPFQVTITANATALQDVTFTLRFP